MGFCFGVERAVNIVEEEASKSSKICTFGPLIHNPRFIKSLEDKGVKQVDSFEDVNGSKLIIRSHGAEKNTYESLKKLGIEYVDATCPIVLKSQKIVSDLAGKGIFTVIVGDPNHSEIKSIKSFAKEGEILVTTNKDDLKDLKAEEIGILAQTTLHHDFFEEFCKIANENVEKVHVYNTICNATLHRQNAAKEMAKESTCVIVVGGKNSSNTKKLASLCANIQPRTHHVESATELKQEWFNSDDTVGITAGASTPESHVKEIINFLENLGY